LIEAIFFDFGGVVGQLNREMVKQLECDYGLPKNGLFKALYGTPEWRAAEIGRGSEKKWLEAAARTLEEMASRPAPSLQEIASQIWGGHDANVVRLVRRLRGHYRVGLLSNSTKRLEKQLLDRDGIRTMFHVVINSARVGVAKPDARIYHRAAEMIGAEPAACIHIDDLEDNVRGARDAGFAAIHHQGDYAALERELRALGVEW
jgi:putative hydrolase of the HAD superfamily